MAAKKRAKQTESSGATRPAASTPDPFPRVPTWLPATLFVVLTLVLFREFVFSDRMLFGNDTLGLGYATRAFYAQALRDLGQFPRWAPEILGGTPFLEALSGGDSLYPPSLLLLLVLEPYRALGWKLVLHICAAGFFMFGWIRALGASRAAALLGGTAYMLAPYLVSLVYPGHDGKLFVTALSPLLFWAVERHFARPSLKAFSGVALVVALVIYTTHFQMAYFLFGSAGLFALLRAFEVWRAHEPVTTPSVPESPETAGWGPRRSVTCFGLFLAAAITGAGVAAVQLVPAVDYVTESSRRIETTREAAQEVGVEWSSSWSLHPEEALGLVIPQFAGNNSGGADWSQGTYWGRNATRDNHSGTGVVVLLLATVGLLVGVGRRAFRWFFAGLGLLALLFALGAHTPVWRIFYEVVPGIRLFRAPDQVMFLFAFSACTLAALGVDRVLSGRRDDASSETEGRVQMRALWAWTAGIGFLALFAASGGLTSFWTGAFYADIDPGRLQRLEALEPFIVRGAWATFFFALAATGAVWAYRARHVPSAVLVAVLVTLVAADEFRISSGFIRTLDFHEWSAPDPNIQALLRDAEQTDEPYRLLSFARQGQDVRAAIHGIELAAGHHPNDLARYRELIGMVGSGLPQNLLDDDIRRLLNVRYLLWPDTEAPYIVAMADDEMLRAFAASVSSMPVLSRTAIQGGTPYETLLRDEGLPRARLVGAATVKSDEEAVAYMLSDAFDPAREVVLTESPQMALDGAEPTGAVTWRSRSPNELALSVTTERPALLVIADNWFPAWHATVDGAEAPLLRAYHTLRAVPVPAGEHEVVMRYRSTVVRASLWLSVMVFVGLVGALGVQTWRTRQAGREP